MEAKQTLSGQLTDSIISYVQSQEMTGAEYNDLWNKIYEALESANLNERSREDYNALQEYKAKLRERYKNEVESLYKIFPNGIYTEDNNGNIVGANILIRTTVQDLLEKQREALSASRNEFGSVVPNEEHVPIPLTEYQLREYGAKSHSGYCILGRFELIYHKQYKFWGVYQREGQAYLTKIEFVHELKNFFKVMEGQELTLTNTLNDGWQGNSI